MKQDPDLSSAKLIAEPWDIGPGGYQLGGFPVGWSEWNDDYRDTVRRFWSGDSSLLANFARRIHGSADLFEFKGREPSASINFITSHDGYTLNDLVSYQERHNLANGENNRDGHSANFSQNFGYEGRTSDHAIVSMRIRQQRSFLTTLLISQGVPMLLAGDECCRSQQGNNNAYCQDNEINWFDWREPQDEALSHISLIARLTALRDEFPALCSRQYVHDSPGREKFGIMWLNNDGRPMSQQDWNDSAISILGYLLTSHQNNSSSRICLLTVFNNSTESKHFNLPEVAEVKQWHLIIDTSSRTGLSDKTIDSDEIKLIIQPRSVLVLISKKLV